MSSTSPGPFTTTLWSAAESIYDAILDRPGIAQSPP
jgi:hypothetical protein